MEELVRVYAGVSLLKPHTWIPLYTHRPCKKLQEGNPSFLDRSIAVRAGHCGASSWASGSYIQSCTVSDCSVSLHGSSASLEQPSHRRIQCPSGLWLVQQLQPDLLGCGPSLAPPKLKPCGPSAQVLLHSNSPHDLH